MFQLMHCIVCGNHVAMHCVKATPHNVNWVMQCSATQPTKFSVCNAAHCVVLCYVALHCLLKPALTVLLIGHDILASWKCKIQSQCKIRLMLISVLCLYSDAEDAIYERDGYNYDGYTLRVERPRGLGGGGRGGSNRGSSYRGGGGGYGGRDSYGSRGRQSGPSSNTRRSDYRIQASGTFIVVFLSFTITLYIKQFR